MLGAQEEISRLGGSWAGKTGRDLHAGQSRLVFIALKEHGGPMISEPEREQSFQIGQMGK